MGLLRPAGRVIPADPRQPVGLLVDPDRLPRGGLAVIPRPHVRDLLLDVDHRRRHPGPVRRDHVRGLGVAPALQQRRPVHAHRLVRRERQVVVGHRLALLGDLRPDLRPTLLGGVRLRRQRLRHPLLTRAEAPRPATQRQRLARPRVDPARVLQPTEHRPHLSLSCRGPGLHTEHRQTLAAPHPRRLLLRTREQVTDRIPGLTATLPRALTGVLMLRAARPTEQVIDRTRRHRNNAEHAITVP